MTQPNAMEAWEPDLLLGLDGQSRSRLGFETEVTADREPTGPSPIIYNDDAPLCTIAPTRSGKGRSVVVPNLLRYSGPAIVLDIKGELASITARRRREMGQDVYILDPTSYLGPSAVSLNPLDAFLLPDVDLETDALSMAELLSRGNRGTKEPFWDLQGTSFVQALLLYAATKADPSERHIGTILDLISSDDTTYNLAVILDKEGKTMNRLAYQHIAQFLQMPEVTRGGVLATAQAYLKPLMSSSVVQSMRTSSFPLQRIIDGDPITIYLVMPPARLPALRGLVKILIGTLVNAVLSRRCRPAVPTYLMLDEVGQLESFPLLETLVTLSTGYGVRTHMIWQDMAQLRTHYPESWKTILNNCAVIQTFGINNGDLAAQFGGYLDLDPTSLMRLSREQQALALHGRGTVVCDRLDYLRDMPRSHYDDNPLYASRVARGV